MYSLKIAPILLFLIFFSNFLQAQFDPSIMASLSKLPKEERDRLIQQYGSGNTPSSSSAQKNRPLSVDIEKEARKNPVKEENNDLNSYENLKEMEEQVTQDIVRLEISLASEISVDERTTISDELKKYKSLLSRIKELQRLEIQNLTNEIVSDSQKKKLSPFGYDIFAENFHDSYNYDSPIPSDYRVGPGDLIEIQLFGQKNQAYTLEISREGILRFPDIGPINAFEQGTSFIDLKNLLKEKIRENLGEGVQSSITLGAFRSIRIYIFGEVEKQGAVNVSAFTSMINALLNCGGIKETGSLRNVQLKRSGEIITTLDLYDLLLDGDTSADQALQPGDVIFVPTISKQISVDGAVRRPAKYEILEEDTLQDAVRLAGGTTQHSVLSRIRIERLNEDFQPEVRNFNYQENKDNKILSGDNISIGIAGSNIRNIVSIIGPIENEGDYEWREGLLLSDLITNSKSFLPEIDLDYGIIRREKTDGTFHCLFFQPRHIFDSNEKIPLKEQDTVYFFTKESREDSLEALLLDIRQQSRAGENARVIRVSGAVHFQGEYPFTDSMSLQDLILAGGGTKDSAYLLEAEITRVGINEEQKAFVEHLRIGQDVLVDGNRSKNYLLRPYDSLSIKPIPLWREGESIEITGEINFPGTYSIKLGETLFDVIQRAGGLTDRAFADGALFSRENLRIKEDEQKERLIKQLESDLATATLSATDSQEAAQAQSAARAMLSRLQNTESQGRLVIDLNKILKDAERSDLLVKDQDSLFIPSIPYAVSVSGEVQFPTSHLHNEKMDMNDYLNRSGGYTQNADKDRTFVVKSNGAVMTNGRNGWFGKGFNESKISPGDVIVVPIDVKQTRFLENLSYSTQIIYQLAVAAAAVNSF
jgi:protein involved in polysaccharide export with SLBB domain